MKKFTPCRICTKKRKEWEGRPPQELGYYFVGTHLNGYDAKQVIECECHRRWRKSIELDMALSRGNIWVNQDYDPEKDYKGDSSLRDVLALRKYVENFPSFRDKMIYMYGTNGTQKTTLAMWVAKSLVEKGFKVQYTLMESLSVALQPSFENDESEERKSFIHKLLESDLVIIDESFDKSKMNLYKSGYQIGFIDKFIRERFDINKKAIIFISNKKPEEIGPIFGESLESLVTRNVRESTLTFLDRYVEEMGRFNPRGLFE